MIGLAWAALLGSGPQIIELPDPAATRVTAAVVARTPFVPGEREEWALRALGRLLTVGCRDFTPEQLAEVGRSAGVLPTMGAGEGLIRMQFSAAPDQLDTLAQAVESMLKTPFLRGQEAEGLLRDWNSFKREGWELSLNPMRPPARRPGPETVQEVFRQAVQAGTLVIVLAGKFESGQGSAALSARLASMPEAPRRGVARFDSLPLPLGRRPDGFASYELRGKATLASDPGFPALALAATGLGTGKESTAFRILRQQLGLSYQQGAALWPTQGGWVPRLMLIQARGVESSALPAKVREAVLKDIEAWDEEALARMKAMFRAAMEQGLPDAPLWLGEEGPPSPTLEGRSALAALMASLGGDPRSGENLASRAQDVSLEGVRAAARAWIEGASEILLP